jgi:hypothetical protein
MHPVLDPASKRAHLNLAADPPLPPTPAPPPPRPPPPAGRNTSCTSTYALRPGREPTKEAIGVRTTIPVGSGMAVAPITTNCGDASLTDAPCLSMMTGARTNTRLSRTTLVRTGRRSMCHPEDRHETSSSLVHGQFPGLWRLPGRRPMRNSKGKFID